MSAGALIELAGIHRRFQVGEQVVHALDDVNLQIDAGEYISIMGPSGSGKSTLLNLLGLLDRPNDGRYVLDGRETATLNDAEQAALRRHKIGFVFQFFHLVPRLTAAENVELPLIIDGVEPKARKDKVARMLKAVGLSDRADHRPEQLSGGQRQRVAMARATILEPDVLLTDEPTGNLDQASGREVIDVLESLNSRGITLIIVTHDPDLGARARRAIRMLDGRVVEDHAQGGNV